MDPYIEIKFRILELAIKFCEEHFEIENEDTVIDVAQSFSNFITSVASCKPEEVKPVSPFMATNITVLNPHTPNKPTDI